MRERFAAVGQHDHPTTTSEEGGAHGLRIHPAGATRNDLSAIPNTAPSYTAGKLQPFFARVS